MKSPELCPLERGVSEQEDPGILHMQGISQLGLQLAEHPRVLVVKVPQMFFSFFPRELYKVSEESKGQRRREEKKGVGKEVEKESIFKNI